MREIKQVHVHCSDSDLDKHTTEVIRQWHLMRGFDDIGYHWVVEKSGLVCLGRPIEVMPASIRGFNKGALAICLMGRKHFNDKQFEQLIKLLSNILVTFNLEPKHIVGHCELDKGKTCPNFPMDPIREHLENLDGRDQDWYQRDNGIEERY